MSLAGGGGLTISPYDGVYAHGGNGTGSAGAVHVNVASGVSIKTSGSGSTGIWSASIDDPVINIAPGASVTGGPGGVGVYFGGPINTLNNSGYVGTADGVSGSSVVSADGSTTVNNSGITVGDITLGGIGNVINNFAATDQSLVTSSISVGVGIRLELGGSISPTLINAGLIAPGSAGPTTIIANNGGTLNHADLGVVNTAIMTYGLIKDANSVQLTSTANFAPSGLTT